MFNTEASIVGLTYIVRNNVTFFYLFLKMLDQWLVEFADA